MWTKAEKIKARSEANKAVKRGDLPHPSSLPCSDCNHVWTAKGDRRHEYDHYKGYQPEDWLNVQAVCTKCHKQRDCVKTNQTHCTRGHAFTPENTARRPNGTRLCRQCRRTREADRTRPDGYWKKVNQGRAEKLRSYRRAKNG